MCGRALAPEDEEGPSRILAAPPTIARLPVWVFLMVLVFALIPLACSVVFMVRDTRARHAAFARQGGAPTQSSPH